MFAQQELSLPLSQTGFGALVDVARELHDFNAVHQHFKHPVHPHFEIHLFQQGLFLGRFDIDIAGNQVGQHAGGIDALDCIHHFLRHLGQQLQDLNGTLLEPHEARLNFLVVFNHGFNNTLNFCNNERESVQKPDHAKALLALTNDVVRAIGCGDVAQDGCDGADAGQIIRPGGVHLRVALHQDADRTLRLDCVLSRCNRAFTTDGNRHNHAGKQHHVAHRHNGHRVIGDGERFAGCVRQRCSVDLVRLGIGIFVFQQLNLIHFSRSRVSFRQPFSSRISVS